MSNQTFTSLPRILGPWMGTAIVIGTVIGSGVFKKPQAVATNIPEFGLAMLAWVLVGMLALFGALSLAEVAIRFPKAGGNYVFLREGYGRMAGFLWGWVEFWIIRTASIAALASIFTESLHDILKQIQSIPRESELLSFWARQGITCITILFLGLLNARGTRWGAMLQLIVTTVKVISLVGIAVLPFILLATTKNVDVSFDRLQPLWPSDWSQVNWGKFGAAMVGVIWAYHGWMNIAPVAEEVRNPSRNIPISLIAGTLTIITLYLSVNVAYYLVIPSTEIKGLTDRTVAGEYSFRLLGSIGLLFASAAVMTSVFGSLNGNILVGPRLLWAMGQDGLAPSRLSRLHPKYQTPALAILILTAWSVLLVLGFGLLKQNRLPVLSLGSVGVIDINLPEDKSPFDVITDFAMFGAVSFETLAVASIFIFRFGKSKDPLPYRCPLFPVIPMIYVLVMSAVLFNMFREQQSESIIGVVFILVGAIWYGLVLRK